MTVYIASCSFKNMIRQLTIGAGVSEPHTRELSDNSTCNKLFSLQPTVDSGSQNLIVKPLKKDFAGKQEVWRAFRLPPGAPMRLYKIAMHAAHIQRRAVLDPEEGTSNVRGEAN